MPSTGISPKPKVEKAFKLVVDASKKRMNMVEKIVEKTTTAIPLPMNARLIPRRVCHKPAIADIRRMNHRFVLYVSNSNEKSWRLNNLKYQGRW